MMEESANEREPTGSLWPVRVEGMFESIVATPLMPTMARGKCSYYPSGHSSGHSERGQWKDDLAQRAVCLACSLHR